MNTRTHLSAFSLATLVAALSVTAFAADNAVLDKFQSVTNYLTCNQGIRNDMRNAVKKAAADNDMALLGSLLELLAKNSGGKVENATFDIWNDAAGAMVNSALEQRKKQPAQQKELMAGFREGGTTFGLWQGDDVLQKPLDQAMLQVACDILTKKMPQQGLSPALQFRRDKAVYDLQKRAGSAESQAEAIAKVKAFALAATPVTRDDTNAVDSAISATLWHYLERNDGLAYAALASEYQSKLGNYLKTRNTFNTMVISEAAGYHRANKMDQYKAAIAKIEKLPVTKDLFPALKAFQSAMIDHRGVAPATNLPEVERVAKPLFDRRAQLFKDAELMDVCQFMYSIARGKGDVDGAIKAYEEMSAAYASALKRWDDENAREKAAREAEKKAREAKQPVTPFVRDWSIQRPADLPSRERPWFVRLLQDNDRVAESIPYLAQNLNSRNPNGYIDLIRAYVKTGKKDEALKLCAEVAGTNTTANADQKFTAAAYAAIAQATNPQDLVRRLGALRPMSDADAKDGETQVDKDKRFFSRIRGVSKMLFALDSTEAAIPNLKAVKQMTFDMLWPEEKVQYTVRYLDNAPVSADSALRTDVFSKLPAENRMAMYNVYNWFDKNADLKRVKSAEKPHLNADVPGKEALVTAAYDNNGLHVYAKFNDPDAWKARDGLVGGVTMEYSIMPGEDAPWHWNMATSTDKSKDWFVVWDSPRKDFKVGMEYFKEDFCVADNCHVFHFFFPWAAFPYRLPANGDTWRLALIGGWAGQFGALGGGAVHELGRAMQLKFEIPANVRPKLELALLRQAVKDYKSVRGKFENADFWVDPHLGDPAFHEQVAAPFMKELDEVAKKVTDTELNPAEVRQLLDKYLYAFSDFRLALDAKRADWLKAKFFAE